jgi:nitrile hydratase
VNGAQDLGGMTGFGPVVPEPETPVFHAEWEKRALAITLACGALGQWPGDRGRYVRECLPPIEYLTSSYYEIWTKALQQLLLAEGMITPDEMAAGHMVHPAKVLNRLPLAAAQVAPLLARGTPYDRPATAPARFKTGDRVRTLVMNPTTHTRLPRYARGKTGLVTDVHGVFIFPDHNAHGKGEAPHWCYGVTFSGTELWGAESDPALEVVIDCFEPYLELCDA